MGEPVDESTATVMESLFALLGNGDSEVQEFVQLLRDTGWSKTEIGPISSWPRESAQLIYLTMVSTQPQCLIVGPDSSLIYNPAFGRMLRDHRTSLFGRRLWDCSEWAPYLDTITKTLQFNIDGCTNTEKDMQLAFPSGGCLEELVVSATAVRLPPPMRGFYVLFDDHTEAYVRERRVATLQSMSSMWRQSKDLPSLWDCVLQTLSDRPLEFPFAAIYKVKRGYDPDNVSGLFTGNSDDFNFELHGSVGDFEGSLPNSLNKQSSSGTHFQCLLQATACRAPFILQSDDGTLPTSWSRASMSRGYCEATRAAAIFPCSSNEYQYAKAILVIGLATRRPYDEAYQFWIEEIHRKFGDAVAIITSAQEAARTKQEAAKIKLEATKQEQLEKEMVAKELALRSKAASAATKRVEKELAVMEEIEIGFFEYAASGELLDGNNAFYELSGYPQDPAQNTSLAFRNCIYPDDIDLVMSQWAVCMEGKSTTFEMRWNSDSPEGWQWVVAACVPLTDDTGTVTSIWGMTTNIAAQKRVEQEAIKRAEALEKAREVEARFSRYAEIAPVGFLALEPSGLVSYCNQHWITMTGHPPVNAMHEIDFASVIYEEDVPIIMNRWEDTSVRGLPISVEVRLKKLWSSSEGESRGHVWVTIRTLPEFNDDGSVKQIIGALVDISHLKYVESVQQSRMEEAVEAKRQQENFVDMTSHEIRNPLGAVIQCADAICDSLAEMRKLISVLPPPVSDGEASSTEARNVKRKLFYEHIENSLDAADTIKSCSAHQTRIVNDILTLSKMDSKLLQLAPSPVNAATILHNVSKMFGAEAEHSGVEVKTCVDASVEEFGVHWVVLDSGRVLQVLVNLITNAIKFTKGEKEIRRVTICMGVSRDRPANLPVDFVITHTIRDSIYDTQEFAEDPYHLWFSVQDTGCGMTGEEKSKIFSRFTQASKRTYNQYGGSGLGLFISRELVEMQGGEIGVASQPKIGSTFAFFIKTHKTTAPGLDAAVSDGAEAPSPLKNGLKAAGSPQGGTDIPPSEIGVLVVEDNAVNQRVLKKQLQKYGYQVYVADHGLQALDFIKTTRRWHDATTSERAAAKDLDVILMDVEMPIMDGITCSKRIRELQREGSITSHIPIIAVSANARPEQINQTVLAGMDEAVSKPFRIPDLTPKIDRLANWTRSKGAMEQRP